MKELSELARLPLRRQPYVLVGPRQQRRIRFNASLESRPNAPTILQRRESLVDRATVVHCITAQEPIVDVGGAVRESSNGTKSHFGILRQQLPEKVQQTTTVDEVPTVLLHNQCQNDAITKPKTTLSKTEDLNTFKRTLASAVIKTRMKHNQITAVLKAIKTWKSLRYLRYRFFSTKSL